MNHIFLAKLTAAALLTVGLATPASALADEQAPPHAATSTVSNSSAGVITVR